MLAILKVSKSLPGNQGISNQTALQLFQDESWPPEGIQQSIDRVLNVPQIDRYQTGICCRSIYIIIYYLDALSHEIIETSTSVVS